MARYLKLSLTSGRQWIWGGATTDTVGHKDSSLPVLHTLQHRANNQQSAFKPTPNLTSNLFLRFPATRRATVRTPLSEPRFYVTDGALYLRVYPISLDSTSPLLCHSLDTYLLRDCASGLACKLSRNQLLGGWSSIIKEPSTYQVASL